MKKSIGRAAFSQEIDSIDYLIKNSGKMLDSFQVENVAYGLIKQAREGASLSVFKRFLMTYQLTSPMGLTLMCLAESLLRIPDNETAQDLLVSLLHNGVLAKLSLPLVRQGVRVLGEQFVIGEDIPSALKRAVAPYRYSFDMLGEAAKTQPDALAYFEAYKTAIEAVGLNALGGPIIAPGISVKLSALHPRYQYSQIARLEKELVPKIIELAQLAKHYQINLTIDAEEADRLQLSLAILDQVVASSELDNWDGLGLAVQAYQKAAPEVIDFCIDLAKKSKHRLMLRLVKGAYWDSEIKRAQEQGFAQYPVYTHKAATDVNYLLCAQKLFKYSDYVYPQFATHNAHTIAAVLQMAQGHDFEFQRLYGMGEALYTALLAQEAVVCRVYAPVGDYKHLLAYLVRRLLENGANTSFVHQLENKDIPIEDLIADPIAKLKSLDLKTKPKIPLPPDLYGDARKNPVAYDLSDFATQAYVMENLASCHHHPLHSKKLDASTQITKAFNKAEQAFPTWSLQNVQQRAACLYKAADLLVEQQFELMSLLICEGKKTILDAQSEVREAIDYCRYYAQQAEKIMSHPQALSGPTGEQNTLSLHPRGVAVCISPWNFPLAIFLGQIVAALVTGNTVLAKPAGQTPEIAMRAVKLLYQAGIPKDVLQLIMGKGSVVGDILTQDERVALVVFTGSLATAQHINRNLAARSGALASFIAETGGQNAMIVDSSALLEQVVTDAVTSAFNSAGQRCSALRILCIQDEIFTHCVEMLKGAMAELTIGNPSLLATDVGPVIDDNAKSALEQHIEKMKKDARLIYQLPAPKALGCFVSPCAFEINSINQLTQEVFGPVLHVIRYQRQQLPELIKSLNATGYGLTLGIHSRIEPFVKNIVNHTFVGNNYVNRNMIGAVVGVQPFGGQHGSGTGPKAGGPHYLSRFVTEKTLSINTAAIGGNVTLLQQTDLDV